ncbi:hypothetical protein N7539_004573 [Penicillium diatomitis]|uniref:Transposase Tc1-like domain-containing protein n=1 Tax=Penicillium diatomitis TaxID=2819901 RepID=A0A9W9XF21_9EURO|nr:uncharacterized protein N7539_004573 [Penicillium diatomitis]KAJ5489683.1 hypothetical protein N7539_004573 [Penicillium diatomitis]
MPRHSELSPITRTKICALRNHANFSYNKIAKTFPDIPRTTIIRTCQQEAVRGKDNKSLPRTGRPKILTPGDHDLIRAYMRQRPNCRYEELVDLVGKKISCCTMSKMVLLEYMHDVTFVCCTILRKKGIEVILVLRLVMNEMNDEFGVGIRGPIVSDS